MPSIPLPVSFQNLGSLFAKPRTPLQDLEAECLKPYSMALQDIGLSLLKYLSSHRGLTYVTTPALLLQAQELT